jgi:hypothetical protein
VVVVGAAAMVVTVAAVLEASVVEVPVVAAPPETGRGFAIQADTGFAIRADAGFAIRADAGFAIQADAPNGAIRGCWRAEEGRYETETGAGHSWNPTLAPQGWGTQR